MDIQSIVDERLNGPEWLAFLEGLCIAIADVSAGAPAFQRAVDIAKAPLFEGVTEEDGELLEAAVMAELEARNVLDEYTREL
ncbi:hypothetical protein [Pseudoxanthomonas sp. SE1]|uniref:hypothetical protein n=1 Tax=Pseudoxanthomonas sp. SE1 TaxID=1664560 RepID=UPI00240DB3A8|nr:hypothetical protein [Pseudoxanthomonas sp. SE1]WFC43268.1 hypothetical protein OY559_07080 [Pseudoxanthomonas sp. SE1]